MIATSSYRRWTPDDGVAVRTSLGLPPRAMQVAPVLRWSVVFPYNLLKVTDRGEFERRYRARLDQHADRILAELDTMRRDYDGARLCLLCFENIAKPGQWCHRTTLAGWLAEHLDEAIPEL